MKMKLTRKTLGVLIMVLLVWGLYLVLTAQSGAVLEQWETTNGTFKIRVSRRPELFNFLPRYYYEFQAQPDGSNTWERITTIVLDDPVPVPRNQIRFVNNEIGYIFMSYTYAITTDAGKHWSIFNVRTNPPLGANDSYLTIRNVQIEANGSGTMIVYSKAAGNEVELRSKDHGKHWNVE